LNSCQKKKSAKQKLFSRQYASKSLWKVWILVKQLFGKIGLFFYTVVQTLSRQFLIKLIAVAKFWRFTDNKPAIMYTNCRKFFTAWFHKYLLPKFSKKNSKKAWKFSANCLNNRRTFYWHIPSEQKCLCRPISDSKQTIGLSGSHHHYCDNTITKKNL
jgi:hypothetical protein